MLEINKMNSNVQDYIDSRNSKIFFLFVGDNKYEFYKKELQTRGFNFIKLSDFAGGGRMPDVDAFLERIETAGADEKGSRFAVIGLGEYLGICGKEKSISILSSLKQRNAKAKIILLLRGLNWALDELIKDPRFDRFRYSITDNAACSLSFTVAKPSIKIPEASSDIKAMLEKLEEGKSDIITNANINFDKALFSVRNIKKSYEAIKYCLKDFPIDESCTDDDKWQNLLTELTKNNNSIDKVFSSHGLNSCKNFEFDFYNKIASGNEYENVLYFIFLKYKINYLENKYIKSVLNKTNRFDEFIDNIFNTIIDMPHTDKNFWRLYDERKRLIKEFPKAHIQKFIKANRHDIKESIYRLTDNTDEECEEIISWISKNNGEGIEDIEKIYPLLFAYMKKYIFRNKDESEIFTKYFDEYKKQKLANKLSGEFLKKVDEYAASSSPIFFNLQSRNERIDSINKEKSFLFWLDACGVEYLSLIEYLAAKNNLSFRTQITRASLPTITSINKDFYDNWQGTKDFSRKLDDIIHGKTEEIKNCKIDDKGSLIKYSSKYIAYELKVIKETIDEAVEKLSNHKYDSFILASDHGASRLAVLCDTKEKCGTEGDIKGEHSGRCCKCFGKNKIPFAFEDNGYFSLGDYGRFKGSRAADVEVHGGASLEEVLVGIVEFTLKDKSIEVKFVKKDLKADPIEGANLEVFVDSYVKNFYAILNGKKYSMKQKDDNHYLLHMPDIKKAGNYIVEFYDGGNFICQTDFKLESKIAQSNPDFDNLE
jgi:hypothetical protein